MFKFGVNTNNQCGKDFDEVLTNIKAIGFDSVMIAFDFKDDEGKIQKSLDKGLEIFCVHLAPRYCNDLWVQGAACDEYVENVTKQIELCAKYGIKRVVFHSTLGSPGDKAFKPSIIGLVNFQKILTVAENHDIVIALENLDLAGLKHISYLFKHCKSKSLAFCFDVGHNHIYSERKRLLKKYGTMLEVVHLHDNYGGWFKGYDYTKDAHLLPFDGDIDYSEVCNAIANSGVETILLEIHKSGLCVPKIYDKMSDLDYLKAAYARAKQLAQKVEEYKKLS